jgi:hypothetical protein
MTNTDSPKSAFDNPLDTKISASTRFAIEIAAWVAGPWAAADLTGNWLMTIPVLAILVALPGVFSTTGDKRHVVVAVPGRVRLFIEILLTVVAIYSAFVVWTYFGAIVVAVIALAMFVAGAPRAKWLFSNEPPSWPLSSEQTK